jgi:hypothetical protein
MIDFGVQREAFLMASVSGASPFTSPRVSTTAVSILWAPGHIIHSNPRAWKVPTWWEVW